MKTIRSLFTITTIALMLVPAVLAQKPDRSAPPPVEPVPELTLPTLQRFTLSNGLNVLLMEKHNVPLVQVNLMVEAGSVDDPAHKLGLASLTADMLDEGAGDYDALALADAFDFLGARFFISPGDHWTTLGLRVSTSRLASGLDLMADVALRPQFPADELDRLRKERLTALIQQHDQPNAIAAVLFNRVLYGEDHPYGRTSLGTAASLASMTTDDLQAFYGDYFHPGNAALVVVGDVAAEAMQQRLEATFGSWQDGDVEHAPLAEAAQVEGRKIYLVDKPGSAQSIISIGRIGAARSSEDFYTLNVLNTILGGSFTSRLNQNLREDKGYTYGARSGFSFDPIAGPFEAQAAVFTAVTGPALSEFFKELNGIHEPIPKDEFERAKNFLAMRFAQGFQSVSQIAGQVGSIVEYDLPDDYFNQYTQHILAVTKDDVERAARQYVDPDNIDVIVVGDRASIEQQIRDLNLGPVEVLEVTDVLGEVPVVEG